MQSIGYNLYIKLVEKTSYRIRNGEYGILSQKIARSTNGFLFGIFIFQTNLSEF